MTQNIYDTADFFAAYSRLRRSIEGLAGAPEWPALRALLPDLAGRRIVDLGCGFGSFCRFARDQGAAYVLGIDVSENMLAQARARSPDAAIAYRRADLEHFDFRTGPFDLAFSALTLHYIKDLPRLLGAVHAALSPGGRLVVSMEHPIFTAPTQPGWTTDGAGRRIWPIDRYLVEGPRVTDWLAKGVIKRHRTIGTILQCLIRCGFTLTDVEEWRPAAAQLAADPTLAEELDRPMFLLIAAERR